jgi:ectoine hydroxylase-related dioxygenase (phytanoyl-CoA dioxygenase family)
VSFAEQLHTQGYAILEGALDEDSIAKYIRLLEDNTSGGTRRGGRRNLLALTEIRELAQSPSLMELVKPILGEDAFAVRGILFDKQEGANWKVPWHQDVTIAVKDRVETDGYGPWSIKEDVVHVQPPTAVLEQMVSVRLHLDDCPASNGALRVIPGSHLKGRLDQNVIPTFVGSESGVVCEVRRGGALLMKPLTIHASSTALEPRHRRVIHFDYAATDLEDGLEWFERS